MPAPSQADLVESDFLWLKKEIILEQNGLEGVKKIGSVKGVGR